jgi:hypothetical protein
MFQKRPIKWLVKSLPVLAAFAVLLGGRPLAWPPG